jgi:cytochrome c
MIRTAATILALLCFLAAAPAVFAAPAGAELFNRCKICHSVDAGGPNRVGPNLHGVFGRTAGSVPGFAYSPAMKKSGIVWNGDTLTKFLRDPLGFMPGSRMGFPGIADDKALADLIAYLKEATR